MKLIDDARTLWHRLWTVRMAIIGTIYAAAGSAWLLLPPAWQPTLSEPVRWVLAVVGVMLAAAPGVARVIAQPKAMAQVKGDDSDQAGA